MRLPDATTVPNIAFWEGGPEGPVIAPGVFQARLSVGNHVLTESFEIQKDPRVQASDDDLRAQFALLRDLHARLSATGETVNKIRSLRRQTTAWERRAAGTKQGQTVTAAAGGLKDRLAAIEGELIQVRALAYEDTLSYPIKLNNKLAALARLIAFADAAPTQPQRQVAEELMAQVDEQVMQFRDVLARDIPSFESLIRTEGVPAITLES
jgi:small-conductance mechanosensitive channel